MLVLLLAGCSAAKSGGSSDGGSYGAGDPALAAPNPAGGPINPFLSDGQAVLRALDAIAARSGKPLRVTSIDADQLRGLIVDVQEPAKHINVDEYIVGIDGTITGPTPVKMMSMGSGAVTAADVDLQAFDPKAIAFARLSATLREAIKKSGYDDARAKEWQFAGIKPGDRDFIYFEAARARPNAEVGPDLKIIKVGF